LGNHLAGLEMLDWHTSGVVVMMTVLGGAGTLVGPIIGAAIYENLDYFVSKTPIGAQTDLVMGLIFAVCVLSFRRGIAGSWRKTST
jgi:branched-chain amino acid transport system permease protein